MKKFIFLGLLLGVSALNAKAWYTVDFNEKKCIKHAYSPYDYEKAVGGKIQVIDDGIVFYTAESGTMMIFGDTMDKCNLMKNKFVK